MKDSEFLAEAKKVQLDINPVSGVDLQKMVENVVNVSPDVAALARAAVTPDRPFNCEEIASDKGLCVAK